MRGTAASEGVTWLIGKLPPREAAEMVERALPIINTFLARYHTSQARNFLAMHD